MPEPICSAQSQVQPNELKRVQEEAKKVFTAAEAVRDVEILNSMDWKKRLQSLARILGGSWDSDTIVRKILTPLNTAEMPQFRTYTNVHRLIHSTRITDSQLADWLKLASKPNELEKFRETSQQILLGAKLFYYEFIPHQGTAWCFMPQSSEPR